MAEEVAARAKEPYEAPALRELGDANELTAGLPDNSSAIDFDDS